MKKINLYSLILLIQSRPISNWPFQSNLINNCSRSHRKSFLTGILSYELLIQPTLLWVTQCVGAHNYLGLIKMIKNTFKRGRSGSLKDPVAPKVQTALMPVLEAEGRPRTFTLLDVNVRSDSN